MNNCTFVFHSKHVFCNSPHILHNFYLSSLRYTFKNETYLCYVTAESVPHIEPSPTQQIQTQRHHYAQILNVKPGGMYIR